MSTCSATTQGTPDLYGVGIRAAFYLQWFGVVLGAWLRPRRRRRSSSSQSSRSSRSYRSSGSSSSSSSSIVPDPLASLRLLNFYSAAALFLSVIVLTQYPGTLQPAEIYIALLLASGSFWRLVPSYLWRLVTCFRYPLSRHGEGGGRMYKSSSWVLLLAMMCFELWFWTTAIGEQVVDSGCSAGYGFLFSKVALDSPGFAGWNILFVMGMLIGCVGVLAVRMGCGTRNRRRKSRRSGRRPSRVQKEMLRELNFACGFIIAMAITTAVELAVQWNDFGAASDVSTAAQMIPLLVSAGFVAWLLWNRFVNSASEHAGSTGSSMTSSSSLSSRNPQSPPGNGHGAMTEEETSEESSEEGEFAEYDGGGGGGGPGDVEDYPTPHEADIPAMLGVHGAPTMQRPPMAAFAGIPPHPPPPVH